MAKAKSNVQVFEYVVFSQEETDENGSVTKPAEMLSHGMLLANSERNAMMKVARLVDADTDFDKVEVALRPF